MSDSVNTLRSMAGHETRMLLLGAVALFEPVNGYQIRRELMSWRVDEWANINPGSIYHALATLTDKGHLRRHDLHDAGREVAVYEISDAGREELGRLIALSLETVDLRDTAAFDAAFAMIALLDRPTAIHHLGRRLDSLERTIRELREAAELNPLDAPPHALLTVHLRVAKAGVERDWLVETLDDIRSGRLTFRGEQSTWQPKADDPGWQMNADRERYRALLDR